MSYGDIDLDWKVDKKIKCMVRTLNMSKKEGIAEL
jgi:hypothetical protein